MKRIGLLTLLVASTMTAAFAQSYQQGIDLLKQNKRTEAISVFEKLQSNEKDGAKAALALALIDAGNGHYLQGFRHFKTFYDASSNPYAYVYALSNSGIFTAGESATSKEVKQFFQELAEDPKADETTRSFAYEQLASRMEDVGKMESAKETYKKLADIGPWTTVGTFENASGSGFNKDYGVLTHPDKGYNFLNRTGALVYWFDMPLARNDRWWDNEYHYDITNSLIYSQTFVNSAVDRDVVMMVGVSGSMKIWVNDFLVGSESEERNTDNDVYNYVVKLKKGYNRILLQLGASEISNSNFMVRFTDTSGHLITDLTATGTVQSYTKAEPYEVKQIPFAPEAYFEKRTAKYPEDMVAKIMLLNVYNHNDKRYEARKVAAGLKVMAPTSTLVSEYIIEALSRDKNSTDVTKEIEAIKSKDPESLYGLMLRYDDASSKEDWDECSKLLDKRIALYGENEDTRGKQIDLLSEKKETDKLMKAVEEAYRDYPNSMTFVTLEYLFKVNASKDMNAASAVLRNYLSRNYSVKMYELLISNNLKTGNVGEAISMYKKLIKDAPYGIGYYTKLASIYDEMKDYKSALEWQQKAIDKAPYVGSFYYDKGMMYDAMGDKDNAKEMMKKAIMYSPTNYEARKKLRTLDGKKDLFDYFRKNDAEALYKQALADKKDIKENGIFLLDDKQQVVYPENGAVEEHVEYLIQVVTQSGIDDYKEVSLPYNAYTQRLIVEKAEIFKPDGSKVQAETNDNDLVFSSLEKGDAIHISYRLENSYYGKLAEHFWDDFNFNGSYQEQIARYSLIVPSDRNFQYKVYNTELNPVISDADGYKMYVWEKKDIPALEPEPYMPARADVAEKLVVTSIPDWSYVANWYNDVSTVKTKADFEVKEKVKELLDTYKPQTDLEKAKVFYNYIESNCHYSNVPFLHSALTPQRASRTLSTKQGDCKDLSTLFVAMCKEAGLNAGLVLVDTRNNGDKNLDLPTIGFNHCIARLQVASGENYLVELTDNHLPFGAMGSELINANGLFIPRENEVITNAALVKLDSKLRGVNINDRQTTLAFNGSQASIRRVVYKTGAEASEIRSGYIDTKQDDRIKGLNSNLTSEFNKTLKIDNFDLKNLESLSDSVVMDYKFTVDNFTSNIVGMEVFKMPWAESFKSVDFVSLDKRKYNLTLYGLNETPVEREVITVKLPAGKKLAETPKNISIKCPVMTYDLVYSVKADKLVVTREVKYLKDAVTPEEYMTFKSFINKVNEADNKQMALK